MCVVLGLTATSMDYQNRSLSAANGIIVYAYIITRVESDHADVRGRHQQDHVRGIGARRKKSHTVIADCRPSLGPRVGESAALADGGNLLLVRAVCGIMCTVPLTSTYLSRVVSCASPSPDTGGGVYS
ncbi:hypothetical protein GMORB2_5552 [Geosmithia morbida]|uniref:Uncharacterized protein n=1 Tax=Geosmithia morbida TaxID=1094350 RepID=A0A9P4YY10_9HYPO|nr:uncharacterized protein GMORB2_5552 [Geosmithia morbida]KAF4123836.1 hypothetical protein GMORB2_5552 [Geosmithia morbida]